MNEIVKYAAPNNQIVIEVGVEMETVWLNQRQMSELFEKDTDTIGLHLKNIFAEGELAESSTTEFFSVVQSEGNRKVNRKIKYYNLDAIISVGYRVNSIRGTQFRIWATRVLKEKLLESVNSKNAQLELAKVVKFIGRITEGKALEKEEAVGLLNVITDYNYALEILDKYDHQQLEIPTAVGKSEQISIEEVRQLVISMKQKFGGSDLFGMEKDNSLESSVTSIYQTFDGIELYPSPQIKAANLLYFTTKNHSFVDGNKRIAAALFVYFLHKNKILFNDYGTKIIDNNTLVALTLMLAESNPNDKEMLVKVIVNLIQKN
jgi:prophage maintenance system killer protein